MAATEAGVAAAIARALDPVAFARAAGLEPDPWQAAVLRSSAGRILLNCSRQSGKSTIAALLAVHTALHRPDSLVLLLSPGLRQSAELFRRCLDAYRAAGAGTPAAAETLLRLELTNGSRIISLPGTEATIRGFAGVALLVVDEASRVVDPLYLGVRPMLAISGGRLVALSTPWGTRGWWYEAWRGPEDWLRVEVPAEQCPRIPAAFLEEERRTMGEWYYRQEYACAFEDAQSQAFRREDVDAAFAEEVAGWAL
jgi:hypothetical protein